VRFCNALLEEICRGRGVPPAQTEIQKTAARYGLAVVAVGLAAAKLLVDPTRSRRVAL
jgi:hypothetical protein